MIITTQPAATIPSLEWPVAYPRHRGLWTVRHHTGTWATIDPTESASLTPVDPATDPKLPALPHALTQGNLLGYRAGRRAVVATPTSFIKVVRPRRLEQLVRTHHAFTDAKPRFATPAIIATDNDGAAELNALPGTSLHQLIRDQDAAGTLRDHLTQIATAIADLHDLDTSGLNKANIDDPHQWINTTSLAAPTLRPKLTAAAAQLPAPPIAATVVTHGDLHDKNIIATQSRVGLIDLDSAALRPAEDDLANLSVHLELRARQAHLPETTGLAWTSTLLAAYDRHRSIHPERLIAVRRHTWFRLACIYALRHSSSHLVPELLRRAVDDRE